MSNLEVSTTPSDYMLFIRNVKQATGIDLSQYKEAQMKRRLTTLRNKHGHESFASFFEEMTRNKALFLEFLDRMTINVSEFWRNRNRWEVLKDTILPSLSRNHEKLKIWSAACSTGEEPYTLAMIVDMLGLLSQTDLLATDIDEGALDRASKGAYLERSLREVPESVCRRYFTEDGLQYHIDGKLKQAVRFSKQNLLSDTFEEGFDLIVCRNVMIYFTEEAKHLLYQKFARALRPGGILFVGSTEQIFSPSQYDLVSVDTFFYQKSI
ncbi:MULTISPECIES: protein-glutamate O-methyltransferase CheR [unclassified Paenibacillus]|uniref:protein-glutamate O-methyltransferase n=1 Tax=Paenibacillus provencensis TaxID=441151 RepID=A0ABW3PQR5_9BACL|nr:MULTISPECIES: protein-glutamate O-methyltransferase CheR [unclassified Paenibacillus]SFS59292.1 chemotaxis protein methyltransferase CheR [Paenibacillus sp. 453mf]